MSIAHSPNGRSTCQLGIWVADPCSIDSSFPTGHASQKGALHRELKPRNEQHYFHRTTVSFDSLCQCVHKLCIVSIACRSHSLFGVLTKFGKQKKKTKAVVIVQSHSPSCGVVNPVQRHCQLSLGNTETLSDCWHLPLRKYRQFLFPPCQNQNSKCNDESKAYFFARFGEFHISFASDKILFQNSCKNACSHRPRTPAMQLHERNWYLCAKTSGTMGPQLHWKCEHPPSVCAPLPYAALKLVRCERSLTVTLLSSCLATNWNSEGLS